MKTIIAWLAACLGLATAPVWAQGTGVNPTPGSVWTYLGPTYGAGWEPIGAFTIPAKVYPTPAFTGPHTVAGYNLLVTTDPAQLPSQFPQQNFDSIAGFAVATAGSTITNINGIAGYVRNQNPTAGGGFAQNAVAVYGAISCEVNSSQCWGLNTVMEDSNPFAANTKTGVVLQNELDVNVSSPNTKSYGLVLAGLSSAQPASSAGYVVAALDISGANRAQWGEGLWIQGGSSQTGILIGINGLCPTLPCPANKSSMPIDLNYSDAAGTVGAYGITAGPSALSFATTASLSNYTFDGGVLVSTKSGGGGGGGTSPPAPGLGLFLTLSAATAPNVASLPIDWQYSDGASALHQYHVSASSAGGLAFISNEPAATRHYSFDGYVTMAIPTACTGLPAGTLWNSAGTVKVC